MRMVRIGSLLSLKWNLVASVAWFALLRDDVLLVNKTVKLKNCTNLRLKHLFVEIWYVPCYGWLKCLLVQTHMINVERPTWISKLEPFNGTWYLSENGKPRGQFDAIVIAHNGNIVPSYVFKYKFSVSIVFTSYGAPCLYASAWYLPYCSYLFTNR